MMKCRVHHLFCAALFEGKGYSDDFVVNMRQVVKLLFAEKETERKEEQIELCAEPDLICDKCPNLIGGACCIEDNQVVSKDIRLAEALSLKCGKGYRREELIRHVTAALNEEVFENSCRKCRWYEEGLCSYRLLRERYERLEKNL